MFHSLAKKACLRASNVVFDDVGMSWILIVVDPNCFLNEINFYFEVWKAKKLMELKVHQHGVLMLTRLASSCVLVWLYLSTN